jgi:hypothetical protein
MYGAFDGKHVIAFHDEYRVVKSYCELIRKHHDVKLTICKIKNKKCRKLNDFDDLYLVRYNETYVQCGYLVYLQLLSDEYVYDHTYVKDILMRMMEVYEFSHDELKAIKKTIKIMDKIIKDESEFVPELSTLKQMELDYQPYFYNDGIWNITSEEECLNEKGGK